jgi:hypothetical protein
MSSLPRDTGGRGAFRRANSPHQFFSFFFFLQSAGRLQQT